MRIGETEFGLLSMQATDAARRFKRLHPQKLKVVFSAEHGYFGSAAAGERTGSTFIDDLALPVISLYGEHRRPTAEMFAGIRHVVVELCDIGVRCYTYLATLKNMLEACAENGIAVTVVDRPIPAGGIVDGPMPERDRLSFVCPMEVPLCHGMTPGECADFIVRTEKLDVDLEVVRIPGWSHGVRGPWMNFVPPSPAIRSWDSALMYPMLVFTEAYSAIDCDRSGPLAFRVLGADWLDAKRFIGALGDTLKAFGVGMRSYRYRYDGVLFTVDDIGSFRPAGASAHILAYLLREHRDRMLEGSRGEWLDKLMGSDGFRKAAESGDAGRLIESWRESELSYIPNRSDLYK